MKDCLFCSIATGKTPTKLIYEDDQIVGFADINPKTPTHLLIVPKKHISSMMEITEADKELIGELFIVAQKLARKTDIDKTGFRTVFNTGPHSGQVIDHLHLHLLGGRKLGPMG